MTDEILKKIDENIAIIEDYQVRMKLFKDSPTLGRELVLNEALRVAVEHLHTDAFGITAKEYISGKRCLDPVDGLRQIAKILGVKEREK